VRSANATTSRTGDAPSTRKTTTTLRVRSVTPCGSLDLRSWLRRRTMMWLRSRTVATTWLLPPSLRWRHVSGRSHTLTTSSPTSRSTMVALTPTSGCQPTTSRSRRQAATSTTWRLTSRW
jgi:hypothetical protein